MSRRVLRSQQPTASPADDGASGRPRRHNRGGGRDGETNESRDQSRRTSQLARNETTALLEQQHQQRFQPARQNRRRPESRQVHQVDYSTQGQPGTGFQGKKKEAAHRRKEDPKAPVIWGQRLRNLLKVDGAPVCALCEHPAPYVAVTKCNDSHRMCWLCQTRWRLMALRRHDAEGPATFRCPFCKQELDRVYLTSDVSVTYASLDSPSQWSGIRHHAESGTYFADKEIERAFQIAQEFRCWHPECAEGAVTEGDTAAALAAEDPLKPTPEPKYFDGLKPLERHWAERHKKKVCDVCYQASAGHMFIAEMPLYDPDDLGHHRRHGDKNDKGGLQIEPHCWCCVCRNWFFDDEAFEIHWKSSDDHYHCRVCQEEGLTQVALFPNVKGLYEHYETHHHPCPHGECRTSDVVFKDDSELQLHLARFHLEDSVMFSATKRRGVLINLAKQAPAHQRDFPPPRRGIRAGETRRRPMYEDKRSTLWPVRMMAESRQLVHLLDTIPTKFHDPKEVAQHMRDQYFRISETYFPEQSDRDYISDCCQQAIQCPPGGEEMYRIIGKLAGQLWRQHCYWESKALGGRQIEDIEAPPGIEQKRAFPSSQQLQVPGWDSPMSISQASQLLLVLILSAPQEKGQVRHDMIEAVRYVSKYAQEAQEEIAGQAGQIEPETAAEPAAFEAGYLPTGDETSDSATSVEPGPVLGKLFDLPIKNNVSFVDAIDWAIREYVRLSRPAPFRRHSKNKGSKEKKEIPSRVPPALVEKMRASRTKTSLERFSYVIEDLSPFIPSKKLERFASLVPEFHRLRQQQPERKLETSGATKAVSQEWGKSCDLTFHEFTPEELGLLRQYIYETEGLLPTAVESLDQHRAGFEKAAVLELKQVKSATLRPGTWVDSALRVTNRVGLNEEEFPSLGLAPAPSSARQQEPSSSRNPPRSATGSSARQGARPVGMGPALGPVGYPRRTEGGQQRWAQVSAAPKQTTAEPRVACPTCHHPNKPIAQKCVKCHGNMTLPHPERMESAADFPVLTRNVLPNWKR